MTERRRSEALTYRDSGVDIATGSVAKARIGRLVSQTHTDSVLGKFGHFGGMFRYPPDTGSVLVSSADSVGTKILVAALADQHYSIGVDLVNHCVNDILCCGATPLFFLDYFAAPELNESILEELVAGMAAACTEAGCALVGGETAQLPGIYIPGTYDLAGFIVGSVSEERIIDGSAVTAGDVVIGLASDGLHTNGFSLARAALGLDPSSPDTSRSRLGKVVPELGERLADSLLRPHRSYLEAISPLLESGSLHGLAHVTGGGIAGNLERIMPDHLVANIDGSSWHIPSIFRLIQEQGNVSKSEMFEVFNMGIGFVLVTDPSTADVIIRERDDATIIGEISTSSTDDNDRISMKLE